MRETLLSLSAFESYLEGYDHMLHRQTSMSTDQVNFSSGNHFSSNLKNFSRRFGPKSPS